MKFPLAHPLVYIGVGFALVVVVLAFGVTRTLDSDYGNDRVVSPDHLRGESPCVRELLRTVLAAGATITWLDLRSARKVCPDSSTRGAQARALDGK